MDTYTATNSEDLRKSPKGFLTVILTVSILAVVGIGGFKIYKGFQPIQTENSQSDQLVETLPTESPTIPDTLYTYETVMNSAVSAGPLILVNNSILYIESSTDDIVSIYENKTDSYHVSTIEVSLRREALTSLNSMLDTFTQLTAIDDIQVISGYRTQDYQQQLYDADLANTGLDTSTLVAKPGYSEHQTGYALDMNLLKGDYSEDFDGTGDYSWISENCAKYGYILRYPATKTATTMIDYEPWHLRYVGIPHAEYMWQHHLCLEEYENLLHNYPYEGEHLALTDSTTGAQYEVYYVIMDSLQEMTSVPVPTDKEYTISGNNVDGFYVTVDLGTIAEDYMVSADGGWDTPAATTQPDTDTDSVTDSAADSTSSVDDTQE